MSSFQDNDEDREENEYFREAINLTYGQKGERKPT